MWRTVLFASGCDLFYPLVDPNLPGDSRIDSELPITCPAGPPVFAESPRVIIGGGCTDYSPSTSAGIAIAMIDGMLHEGPVDSNELAPITIVSDVPLTEPRLAPNGNELFVTARDSSTGMASIRLYRRTGSTWVHDPDVTFGLPEVSSASDSLLASAPSGGAAGRSLMVSLFVAGTAQFVEHIDDGNGTWNPLPAYGIGDLGVETMTHPNMTVDGRRLVFIGNVNGRLQIRHAERAATGDRFAGSAEIATVLTIPLHPYLTPNCERLYVVNSLNVNTLDR